MTRVDMGDVIEQVARARRKAAFVAAERDADFVAVCLIGPPRLQPREIGSNAVWWPTSVRLSSDWQKAADRADIENWGDDVVVLRHVWCATKRHATRLKDEVVKALALSDDMRHRRRNWIDWPEWEVGWDIIVQDALRVCADRGETIELFTDGQRVGIIWQHARNRSRG